MSALEVYSCIKGRMVTAHTIYTKDVIRKKTYSTVTKSDNTFSLVLIAILFPKKGVIAVFIFEHIENNPENTILYIANILAASKLTIEDKIIDWLPRTTRPDNWCIIASFRFFTALSIGFVSLSYKYWG